MMLGNPNGNIQEGKNVDPFLIAAIEEAERGLSEGGIPIGTVLVHSGAIVGRGHNRRVQKGSTILHGEMDALENAGPRPATFYRASTLYTTLSLPCPVGRFFLRLVLTRKGMRE